MRVAPTDEQELLRKTARRLAETHAMTRPPEAPVGRDDPLWKQLVSAGLIGLGTDGTAIEAVLVTEELAAGPTAVPFVGAGVLGPALLAAGGAAPGGGQPVTVALHPALDRLATDADETVVVFDAAGADSALLLGSGGSRLLRIAVAGAAAECSPDLTRSMRISSGTRPDSVGTISAEALARWQALALCALSADLVGVMRGSLGLAVDYARIRSQFGQPIGSFQAIQHLCADQLVSLESARAAVWYAAWCLDHRPLGEALRAARTAKAYCSDVGRTATEACIQVHGGIGVTWECMAHVYLRRAVLDASAMGDTTAHLQQLIPAGGGR